MTSLINLPSICEKGLIPRNGDNSKMIGDKQEKVFFSEGFEGAVALFVDLEIVYDRIKNGQMEVSDERIKKKTACSKCLADYLGEGVYLRFDGTGIENERNFENGCTDKIISPKELAVCILRSKSDGSVIFSRFEIAKYMMSRTVIENIRYYGASYAGSPDFDAATNRIQGKVREYYEKHKTEIDKYRGSEYVLEFVIINDFLGDHIGGLISRKE